MKRKATLIISSLALGTASVLALAANPLEPSYYGRGMIDASGGAPKVSINDRGPLHPTFYAREGKETWVPTAGTGKGGVSINDPDNPLHPTYGLRAVGQ